MLLLLIAVVSLLLLYGMLQTTESMSVLKQLTLQEKQSIQHHQLYLVLLTRYRLQKYIISLPQDHKESGLRFKIIVHKTIVPTDFELMDENTPRPITNYSGSVYSPSASLSPREIGIIAKNPDQFLTDFPTYRGPLFKSTATLNDNGNTLGLRLESTGNILDTITYTRDDGAYGDGDSLHVRRSGLITADTPSPGDGIEQQPESPRPSGGGTQQPTQTTDTSIPSFYLLSVDDRNVQEGQNLFFTNASSTTVKLRITDDITEYTSTNIDRYLTINLTDIHESGSEKSRIEKIRSVNFLWWRSNTNIHNLLCGWIGLRCD